MPAAPIAPAGRPFSRADLAGLPDDGRRHELVDGVLIVSAVPGRLHQRAAGALSRSTKLIDLNVKRERLRRTGAAAFWAVDPSARPAEARLLAWELDPRGEYRPAADVTGEVAFDATVPFPVRVVPADLVRWPPVP